MKKISIIGLVMLMLMTASAGVLADEPERDIVDTAIEAEDFETLVAALEAAELVDALKGEGPFTVFAPTDAAFEDLPAGLLEKLLENPDILEQVLLYHVVAGEVLAADVVDLDGEEVETLLPGQTVEVNLDEGDVFINDSQVIATDILATNGAIHVVDEVLLPDLDIVDTAILDDDFNILVTALEEAELVDALRAEGPFTVFAPTDAAFEALPDGMLEDLLDDPAALANVLLYHVVDGKVMAADVVELDGEEVATLQGQSVAVSVEDGNVFLNEDVQVIAPDVEAANGVIHAIDGVLEPEEEPDPEETVVNLNIGEREYTINGEEGLMDVAPFIEGGRTFVPVRFVAEAFGMEADWGPREEMTEWVTFEKEGLLIEIEIGSADIKVTENGAERTETADVAAQIVDGRTFLPLRAVGEILGAEFDWSPKDAPVESVSFIFGKV